MADIHRRPGGPYPAPRMDGSHRDVLRGTDDLDMVVVPSDDATNLAVLEALRWADHHRDHHLFDRGADHVNNLITVIHGLRAKQEQLLLLHEQLHAHMQDRSELLREIAQGLELLDPSHDEALNEAHDEATAYANRGPAISRKAAGKLARAVAKHDDTRRGLIFTLRREADQLSGTRVR